MYIKVKSGGVTEYPYDIYKLRRENPNVSFPRQTSDELLAEFGVFPVEPDPQPEILPWQEVSEGAPVFVAGKWRQVWTISEAPFQEFKANMIAALAARRWEAETGGTTFNGMRLATDAVSQTKYIGAVVGVQFDPNSSLKWKLDNGTFTQLNAGAVVAVAMAVRAHIQACFDREAELKALIDAAQTNDDLAQIDLNSGWPS